MGDRSLLVAPDFSDGDSQGPARVVASGDDVFDSLIVEPDYRVVNGKLNYDGTRMRSGYQEPNDDDTVSTVWTQYTPGAGSIAKSGGVVTMTCPAAQGSDWNNGTYNAVRNEGEELVYHYTDWEFITHRTDDGVNDQGSFTGVLFDNTDASFFVMQAVRSVGNNLVLVYRGPNVLLYNQNVGATASWNKIAMHGGVLSASYYNAVDGSEPSDSDWNDVVSYTPVWAQKHYVPIYGTLNIASLPGCTIDFGTTLVRDL